MGLVLLLLCVRERERGCERVCVSVSVRVGERDREVRQEE